jgi:hypothetical protein
MRAPVLLASLAALLHTACKDATHSSNVDIELEESKHASSVSISEFWSDFQGALRSGDPELVAKLTAFPLEENLSDLSGLEDLGTEAGFIANFRTVFPVEAVQSVVQMEPEPLPVTADSPAGSTSWILGWHSSGSATEQNCSIHYTFTRMPDGRILLAAITFAG